MQRLSLAAERLSATIKTVLCVPTFAALLLGGVVFLGTSTEYSNANGTLSKECALRDLQVLIRLEQHADAKELPSDQIAAAFFNMLQARAVCGEQKVAEALALYDRALPASLAAAAQK